MALIKLSERTVRRRNDFTLKSSAFLITLGFLSLVQMGCTNYSTGTNTTLEYGRYPELQSVQVKAEAQLTSKQSEILTALINNDPLKFETIVDAAIESEASRYEANSEKLNGTATAKAAAETSIKTFLGTQKEKVASVDVLSMKESYEADLGEILYNKAHNTAGSPVDVKKAQCLSGTTLFTLVNSTRGYEMFAASHQVVVLESGHILPAVMQLNENAWQMNGIETTVAGKGIKNYGKVSELDKLPEPRRVLRADYFLLMLALGDKVENLAELQTTMLKQTAAQYGIPLEKLEESVQKAKEDFQQKLKERQESSGSSVAEGKSTVTGSSDESSWLGELSFGEADVPEGNIVRQKQDEVFVMGVGHAVGSGEGLDESLEQDLSKWDLSKLASSAAELSGEGFFNKECGDEICKGLEYAFSTSHRDSKVALHLNFFHQLKPQAEGEIKLAVVGRLLVFNDEVLPQGDWCKDTSKEEIRVEKGFYQAESTEVRLLRRKGIIKNELYYYSGSTIDFFHHASGDELKFYVLAFETSPASQKWEIYNGVVVPPASWTQCHQPLLRIHYTE